MKTTNKYIAMGEMMDYCEEYNIYSFADLLDYCIMERFDWFRILCDNNGAAFMCAYLESRKWSKEQNLGDIIVPETGEVLQ